MISLKILIFVVMGNEREFAIFFIESTELTWNIS